MQRTEISQDVLEFIARRIDSVPHLEALLLLWKDPGVLWADEEVSRRVYVSREQAKAVLQDLARHGLITAAADSPDRYHYNEAWDEAGLMPRVAAAYRGHLVHVAGLIHAKAASGAVQEFARAFKLRQKD